MPIENDLTLLEGYESEANTSSEIFLCKRKIFFHKEIAMITMAGDPREMFSDAFPRLFARTY